MHTEREGGEPDAMPNLAELITSRKRKLGYSYRDLERLADDVFTYQRWNQLGNGTRIKEFPEPATIAAIARALDVDVLKVLSAIAVTLGMDVRQGQPELATMLPASARDLSPEQRDAVLAVIKAMNPPAGEAGKPASTTPPTPPTDIASRRTSRPSPKPLPKAADTPRRSRKGEAFDAESGEYVGRDE